MAHSNLTLVITALAMLGLAACGGSSGSGAAATATTPVDATQSVDAVSVDVSNLDASQQASASANITTSKSLGGVLKGFGADVDDVARAGCELYQIKKEAIRVGNQTDAILCYLGTTQEQTPAFIVDSTQRYYTMTVPAGEGEAKGSLGFTMRIQKDDDGLKMDMCEGGTNLTEELTIAQSASVVTATGFHHFQGGEAESNVSKGNPGAGFDDKGGFSLALTLKDTAAGDIDYTDIDSGTLDATFVGNYGSGRMTFAKAASADLNDISGVFAASFGSNNTFTAQIIGRTDATQGTSKYSVTGTFPGIPMTGMTGIADLIPNGSVACPSDDFETCNPAEKFAPGGDCQVQTPPLDCFCLKASATGTCTFTDSGVESFAIATNATTKAQTFTIVAGSDANYYSYVNGLELPNATITTPAATRNWDCSTSGQTVVSLDVTGVDYSVCDAKSSKGFASEEKSSCHQQETSDKAGDGVTQAGNN